MLHITQLPTPQREGARRYDEKEVGEGKGGEKPKAREEKVEESERPKATPPRLGRDLLGFASLIATDIPKDRMAARESMGPGEPEGWETNEGEGDMTQQQLCSAGSSRIFDAAAGEPLWPSRLSTRTPPWRATASPLLSFEPPRPSALAPLLLGRPPVSWTETRISSGIVFRWARSRCLLSSSWMFMARSIAGSFSSFRATYAPVAFDAASRARHKYYEMGAFDSGTTWKLDFGHCRVGGNLPTLRAELAAGSDMDVLRTEIRLLVHQHSARPPGARRAASGASMDHGLVDNCNWRFATKRTCLLVKASPRTSGRGQVCLAMRVLDAVLILRKNSRTVGPPMAAYSSSTARGTSRTPCNFALETVTGHFTDLFPAATPPNFPKK
ncbi:hypothetical protein HDZ31DRAFT_75854 [Schizophyllum fasciatum]